MNETQETPVEQNITETERKTAKMLKQFQQSRQFFATVTKGLMKIIEDVTTAVLKR